MATRGATVGIPPRVVVGAGLVLISGYVVLLLRLMSSSTYDTWGALIIGPVLAAVTYPALVRQAKREGDRRVLVILCIALIVKLLFSIFRYYQVVDLYAFADATGYHGTGAVLSERFLAGDFDTTLPEGDRPFETHNMFVITGIIYMVIKPSLLGGFVTFSWLAFLGLFCFYRAFHLAVPEGRTRAYGLLLFFLPSMLFWPASIGKEAWTMFTLGVAAFGAARLFTGQRPGRGAALLVAGMAGTAVIRPHFAGLMAVALAIGFLARRASPERGRMSPLAKVLALGGLAFMALVLVTRTQEFFGDTFYEGASITSVRGVASVLEETARQTGVGGSRFDPANVTTPQGLVVATATVLFRPFPFEADNLPTMLAAVEGILLIGVLAVRVPWAIQALRLSRRRPYLAAAMAYCAGTIIALSGIANFGILTRQRVLLLPMLLVLLSVPRPSRRPARAG